MTAILFQKNGRGKCYFIVKKNLTLLNKGKGELFIYSTNVRMRFACNYKHLNEWLIGKVTFKQ